MHTRLAFRRIATIFGAVCMLLIVWHLYWRPVILRVAVGPVDSGQWRFVQATAKALKDTGQPFRLRLVPVEQSTSASAALEKGVVDLAVLRSDDPTSTEARSICNGAPPVMRPGTTSFTAVLRVLRHTRSAAVSVQ